MRNTIALMNEFAAAFQFPIDNFGDNWYALKDCLKYLDEWLPAKSYIVFINYADQLLVDENPDELKWLLLTLQELGRYWGQPVTEQGRFNREAVPFHTLFKCERENMLNTIKRFNEQSQDIIEITD